VLVNAGELVCSSSTAGPQHALSTWLSTTCGQGTGRGGTVTTAAAARQPKRPKIGLRRPKSVCHVGVSASPTRTSSA